MKLAANFRQDARKALNGKWALASITAFFAWLLGGLICSSASTVSSSEEEKYLDVEYIKSLGSDFWLALVLVAVIFVVLFFVSGAATLGYARFNLNLVDGKKARFGDLFSQFHRFGTGIAMQLLTAIYIFLWLLLLLVPGLIKIFSYAMTPYILYEDPNLSANQAITKSRHIMNGNKFRLFCLQLSFIGWALLTVIPGSIGLVIIKAAPVAGIPLIALSFIAEIVLCAYMEAANAAFYRDITCAAPADETAA